MMQSCQSAQRAKALRPASCHSTAPRLKASVLLLCSYCHHSSSDLVMSTCSAVASIPPKLRGHHSLQFCGSSHGGSSRDPIGRAHPHKNPENDRYKKQRGHIGKEMPSFSPVAECLPSHDCSMDHARPHSEPDYAFVRVRITRRYHKEHTERGIDADDHHQV